MKTKHTTLRPLIYSLALSTALISGANAALFVTVNSYTGSYSSIGNVSLTVSGTVDELGTSSNNRIVLGQTGVDWIYSPSFDVGRGGGSGFSYHTTPHNVGNGVYWANEFTQVDNQDQFSLLFDQDFVVGDTVDFTFVASVGTDFNGGSYLDFNALSPAAARVGYGSLSVPEPSSTMLLGLGGLGLILRRKRTA